MAVLEIVSNIRHTLANAISYIQNQKKTTLPDGTRLIASNMPGDLSPQKEARRMLERVAENPRGLLPSTRVAQHLVQSWSDDDAAKITPQQALELGRRMAEEITGGTRLYVVAVHVSQARLHCHIIICNHDQATGRANQWGPRDLQRWRKANDRMSQEIGLSTLPEPKTGHEIPSTPDTRTRIGSLYAQALGTSWTEGLKNHIDEAAARSNTFKEFRAILHEYGVSVIPRGKHFTYMLSAFGTKIRDTRLGEAYTPTGVLSAVNRRPVTEISFSEKLIIARRHGAVRIMIPGTHGDRRISIREDQVLKTGPNSYHAWIPQDRPITLTNRRGSLAGRITAADLTRDFIQPNQSLLNEYRTLRPKITDEQAMQANRAYVWQAMQIARSQQEADALRIVEANDGGAHNMSEAIDSLLAQVSDCRSSLAAQIAAMADAQQQGTINPAAAESPQARALRTEQIRGLEEKIQDLTWQIRTVKTVEQRKERDQDTGGISL